MTTISTTDLKINIDTNLSEVTNFNNNSPSFGWLHDEPDLYTRDDCQVLYR